MNKTEPKIGYGMIETPKDGRDFSFGAAYTLEKPKNLPEEYEIQTLGIKDQGQSNKCTAYAGEVASEAQEGLILNPDWKYAQILKRLGKTKDTGSDLRTMCQSFVDDGSIANDEMDTSLKVRNPLDWRTWPISYAQTAQMHRKKSFFDVEGPYDAFDNFRTIIAKNKEIIVTGVRWRRNWLSSSMGNGVIPPEEIGGGYLHALAITGWKQVEGEPRIIAQNSWGKKMGDKGRFYYNREVFNREFTFGGFTFVDISPQEAKYHLDNKLKVDHNWFRQFLSLMFKI